MSAPDLKRVEIFGAIVLGLVVLASALFASLDFTYGVAAGGALGLINFRVVRVLLGKVVAGGANSAWVVIPLLGKSGLLMGLVLVLGIWLQVDVIGLALGFSSIVMGVAIMASLRLLQPIENGQE